MATYLSKYAIGEEVVLKFSANVIVSDCIIKKVSFTKSKVLYDIIAPVEHSTCVLKNVNSVVVCDKEIK